MSNQTKGVLYIVLSSFFFSLMALAVKFTTAYPIYEKMFFRGIVAVVVIGMTMKRDSISFIPKNLKLNLLRSTFGALGVFLYYYALSKMQLSDAVMLNKLSPFFVMAFSFLILKESISKHQVISIVTALLGALLIIKPSFDLSILPALVGLASAMVAGAAYTVVRALRKYDDPRVIVFFFSLYTVIASIPFMLIYGFVVPTLSDLLPLIGIGVTAMIAQIFMTNGYKYAEASKISIYSYTNVVFSLIFSIFIFNELPDRYSAIGMAIIISSAVYNYVKLNVSSNTK